MPRGLLSALLAPQIHAAGADAEAPWHQGAADLATSTSSSSVPYRKAVRESNLLSSFVDLSPLWHNIDPMPDDTDPGDDMDLRLQLPQTDDTEWLGVVEDKKYLDSTDLITMRWVGLPHPVKGRPKPGMPHQQCDEFMKTPHPGVAFWHPKFKFKEGQGAVRVRLTDTSEGKGIPLWDVIFAGKPGGPKSVVRDAVPAGGKQPLFKPFCPPLKLKAKFELRLTEAVSQEWDEKLTLLPAASVHAARLKWLQANKGKPRLPIILQSEDDEDTDGALASSGPTLSNGPDEADALDKLKTPSYFSIPPLVIAGSLLTDFL